jgi:hypothetical protein
VQRSFNARRGLLSVHVTAAGEDLELAIEAAPSDGAIRVTHVDLCMDDPGVARAVEVLRRRGFFFCALLPEFAHTDVLRMQRLTQATPTSYALRLANIGARRLLDRMRAECG